MGKYFFVRYLGRFVIPLLVPIVILGGYLMFKTEQFVMNEVNYINSRTLEQMNNQIDQLMDPKDFLHYTFHLNSISVLNLQAALEEGQHYNAVDVMRYSNFMNLLNSAVNSNPYVHSIYLYYPNEGGRFLASNEGIATIGEYYDSSWVRRLPELDKNIHLEKRMLVRFNQEIQLLTIYSPFHSPGSSQEQGFVILNIKRSMLRNLLEDLPYSPQQSVFILDKEGRVLSGVVSAEWKMAEEERGLQDVYDRMAKDSGYVVASQSSTQYPLCFVSATSRKAYGQLSNELEGITIILLIVSLVLGVIFAYILSRRNYRNLVMTKITIDHAVKGLPIPELPNKVKDEYSYILQNIIKTFVEQRYLKVQLSEKKYRLKAMEMMALQSNINPHFMSNTLRSIFWKSMQLTGGHNEVSRMIDYLAEVVHYSLTGSNRKVSLREEIYHTYHYIEILKIRYRDKFKVIFDFDDSYEDLQVIKLLFQPLIENSIYHGIMESGRFGFIKIRLNKQGDDLQIRVIDTGVGMTPDQLQKLKGIMESEEQEKHIGLFNIYKRLQLMYEHRLSFRIRSKYGWGTIIDITLPI